MWYRLFNRSRRAAKRRKFSARKNLSSFESLEQRAMLAATAIGDELLVNDPLQASQRFVAEASDVAITETGESLTVFHGRGLAGERLPGDDREIFLARFDADGAVLGDLVRVNSVTRGDQYDPVIDVAADGSFMVVWNGRGLGDRVGVFAQRFDADASPVGEQFRVNTTRGGDQLKPELAMNTDGASVVVWHGMGDGDFDGIFMQRFAADGTPDGDETLVNSTTDGEQAYASVDIDDLARSVVTWSSRGQDSDGWGIFGQRVGFVGSLDGDEFAVNTTTAGSQHHSSVGKSEDGEFVVAWSSFGQDGDSWGVVARQFSATAEPASDEISVNEMTTGHQRDAEVAVAPAGEFLVAWSHGEPNGAGWEVSAQTFNQLGERDGDEVDVNQATSGADSGNQRFPSVGIGPDGSSLILFHGNGAADHHGVFGQRFDVDVEPPVNVGPVIEQLEDATVMSGETFEVAVNATDANRRDVLTFTLDPAGSPESATIRTTGDLSALITWTPTAEDRGNPVPFRVIVEDEGGLADATQFFVTVSNAQPIVDLNGDDPGANSEFTLDRDTDSAVIVTEDVTITDVDDTIIQSARIELRVELDVGSESLSVDTGTTGISQSFAGQVLTLSGSASLAEYESVLRTLRYENTVGEDRSGGIRDIDITVNDGRVDSEEVTIRLNVLGTNSAPQLPVSLEDTIEVNQGSPLHIPLNGIDIDGDDLTYTVSVIENSANIDFEARVLTGNRSMRISVADFGDMVFQLFEGRAPDVTSRIIELASDEFYDDLIFHRIVNGFVIQGGDPLGNGTGGSGTQFDDQFHVELQHNRSGMLSMAKSNDDTNDSQFFITEGPQRDLDFNHSVFGILVDGEDVREEISNVPTSGPPSNRPFTDVVMQDVEIFTDRTNGVLVLNAPHGVTGTVTVSVTVSDGQLSSSRQFTVNVVEDEFMMTAVNSAPFLEAIDPIETTVGTPATVQLVGVDVEGDRVFFLDQNEFAASTLPPGEVVDPPPGLTYEVDRETGLLTVTPSAGLAPGTYQITVAVARTEFVDIASRDPYDLQVVDVIIT